MFKIRNLTIGYENTKILNDINFNLKCKMLIGIIGDNGSGKSTLLKSIMGLCRIFRGTIEYKGQAINEMKTYEISKMGICFIPQNRALFNTLTVDEHFQLSGITKEKLTNIYNEYHWLKRMKNQKTLYLSGGQQRFLSLLTLNENNYDTILLDEPSANLDLNTINRIEQTLKKLSKNKLVLVVEQNQEFLFKITKNIYHIEDGRLGLSQ